MKRKVQFAVFARSYRFKRPDYNDECFQGIFLAYDRKDMINRYCSKHNNVWVSAVPIPDSIIMPDRMNVDL